MMSAQYFEYYTIILRGGVFSWTHSVAVSAEHVVTDVKKRFTF